MSLPHPHCRVECARCGTVLVACLCAPGQQTVGSCNACLSLSDAEAAYAKEHRPKSRS